MLVRKFQVGRLGETNIYLTTGMFAVLALAGITVGLAFCQMKWWIAALAGIIGSAVMLIAYGLVLIHELAHVFTARFFGGTCRSLTLGGLMGAVDLDIDEKNWRMEFGTSFAGPASNAAVLGLLMLLPDNFLKSILASISVMLIVINILPVFPLDGGRMLRALLARMIGHARATAVAMWLTIIATPAICIGAQFARSWGITLTMIMVLFLALKEERARNKASLAKA